MKYHHTTSREIATNKGEVNWSEITAAGTSYLIASFKERGNNSKSHRGHNNKISKTAFLLCFSSISSANCSRE